MNGFHAWLTGFGLPLYTLGHIAGAVVAVTVTTALAYRLGLPVFRVLPVLLLTVAGVWVGARLGHFLFNIELYLAEPERFFALRFRGIVLYGGLVGGMAVALPVIGWLRVPKWPLADAAAVGGALGIALIRMGCFGRGCCFGTVTNLPWGITYPVGSPAWAARIADNPAALVFGGAAALQAVHPAQLYELVAALVAAGMVLYMIHRNVRSGLPALSALIGFTGFRLVNWRFRETFSVSPLSDWFHLLFHVAMLLLLGVLAVKRYYPSSLPMEKSGSGRKRRSKPIAPRG